jgi:sugar-specific transcriptional regulator TrmB
MITSVLKDLGLSDAEIKLYLKMLGSAPLSARQIAENLGIPRASAYDKLRILIDHGLALELAEGNKKVFVLNNPEHLLARLQEKIDHLEQDRIAFTAALPELQNRHRYVKPEVKYYDSEKGIRHIFSDILWYENITLKNIVSFDEAPKVLDQEFRQYFERKRLEKNIAYQIITSSRERRKTVSSSVLHATEKLPLTDIRIAPNNQRWNMSKIIYADKVAYISSKQEGFGFVVQSLDAVELATIEFDLFWQLAKP